MAFTIEEVEQFFATSSDGMFLTKGAGLQESNNNKNLVKLKDMPLIFLSEMLAAVEAIRRLEKEGSKF